MTNPKLRHMVIASGPYGPELAVQLEDGRLFKLRGHEDSDDDGLRWVPLPDFPESDAERGARLRRNAMLNAERMP